MQASPKHVSELPPGDNMSEKRPSDQSKLRPNMSQTNLRNGCGPVKKRYPKWNPGKWKHGLNSPNGPDLCNAKISATAPERALRRSCSAKPHSLFAGRAAPEAPLQPAVPESQSKPGIKMLHPNQCKELQRRPQLILAGTFRLSLTNLHLPRF